MREGNKFDVKSFAEKRFPIKNLTIISVFSQFFWKANLIETVYEYTRQLKENERKCRRLSAEVADGNVRNI